MKRLLALVLIAVLTISLAVGCTDQKKEDKYPEKQITAIIPFGPGGSTDIVGRAISPLTEKLLKQSIVVKNVSGGNGAIGAKEVVDKAADGYTLFITAENLASYKVMDISQLSFADYEPIILLSRGVPVIVAKPEAKWQTVNELLKEANEKPEKIKISTTGPTGISGIVSTMLGAKFNMVPFKSEGEMLTALLGGHVDIATVGLLSAVDYVKSGKLKVLAVVNDTKLPAHADWPALGEAMPEYNKYLPWGPFYGVWVKKGTPEPVVNKLKDSFKQGASSAEFKEFLAKNEMIPLNLSGQEALDFVAKFTSKTTWLLYEGGATKKSPSDLGIPKP